MSDQSGAPSRYTSRNWLVRLASVVGLYAVAQVVASVTSLATRVVLARYLGPEDMGRFGLVNATITGLAIFIGLNPQTFVTTEFHSAGRSAVAGGLAYSLRVGLATALACALALPWIWTHSAPLSSVALPAGVLAVAVALTRVSRNVGRAAAQIEEDHRGYVAVLSGPSIAVALSLAAAAMLTRNWLLVLAAEVVAGGAATIWIGTRLRRSGLLATGFSDAQRRAFLALAVPVFPYAAATWASTVLDRFLLARLATLSEVGVYDVAYSLCAALELFNVALLGAFSPRQYRDGVSPSEEARRGVLRLTGLCAAATVIAGLGLWALLELSFGTLLGEEYARGEHVAAWLVAAYVFNGIRNLFAGYFYLARRAYLLAFIAVCAVGLNAGLNLAWIPEQGALGSARAAAATFGAIATVTVAVGIWLRRRAIAIA